MNFATGGSLSMQAIERFFRVHEKGSTLPTEVRAGVTTFMAMAYIIFANPAILSAAGVPFSGAVVATCVAAGLVTILMGLATNYPICLAAGMGLNAVVAYNIVLGLGYTWQTAMGVIVLEGLVVLVLSLTALRQAVMDAIPTSLKHAIAVGIGLFLTFIGLQSGNLLSSNPATLVEAGDFTHPVAVLAILGLLITGWLVLERVRGAILIGIVATAILGMLPIWHVPAGVGAPGVVAEGLAAEARWAALVPLPHRVFDLPRDWSTFFAFDLKSALTLALLPLTFAVFMTDFFDTMGTAIAIGTQAGFLDSRGRIPRIRNLLVVDSLGAVAGGLFGCSSNTCYIESSAGVAEGGRTGLTSVVCGALFLVALFFTPLFAVVGGGVEVAPGVVRYPVTSAALIIIGFLMMSSVLEIAWSKAEEALPAFLVMVVMPMTFSITHGIGAGFIAYVAWKTLTGKAREIRFFLWVVAFLFVLVFALPALESWFAAGTS
jgi:AGZA family xanthine/uracil permease-like MFS transporter